MKKNITEIEMLYLHEAALVDDALRSNKNKAKFKLLNAKMDLVYTRALNGDFSLDGTFSDGKSINKFNGNIRTKLNKYKKMNKKLSEGELELVHTIALYDNLVREEKRAKYVAEWKRQIEEIKQNREKMNEERRKCNEERKKEKEAKRQQVSENVRLRREARHKLREERKIEKEKQIEERKNLKNNKNEEL